MFEYFWLGKRAPYSLSLERFINIVTLAGMMGAEYLPGVKTQYNGMDVIARSISFFNSPEYSLVFGTATIYYDMNNDPIGFYDVYDFNAQEWGKRAFSSKIKTRLVLGASNLSNASPFIIKFP